MNKHATPAMICETKPHCVAEGSVARTNKDCNQRTHSQVIGDEIGTEVDFSKGNAPGRREITRWFQRDRARTGK